MIRAFDKSQQKHVQSLYDYLKNGHIRDINTINFADDLIQQSKYYQLSKKQVFWVKRLCSRSRINYNELTNLLDKLEARIRNAEERSIDSDTLLFAEDLINKGRKYKQLSEKQLYWVEKLIEKGIHAPASIYCSICKMKGHSSSSHSSSKKKFSSSLIPNFSITSREENPDNSTNFEIDVNDEGLGDVFLIDPEYERQKRIREKLRRSGISKLNLGVAARKRFDISESQGRFIEDDWMKSEGKRAADGAGSQMEGAIADAAIRDNLSKNKTYIGDWKKDNMPDFF